MAQTTRVLKLSASEQEALEARLAGGSFEYRSVPHARLSVKGEGVVATLYTSGKLVVQGPDPDLFVARFAGEARVEPPRPAAKDRSGEAEDAVASLLVTTIGSDETGKGDYFGPLVVAAVRVEPEQALELGRIGVMDSKKLTDARALRLGAAIREGLPHAVESLEPPAYNEAHAAEGNLNPILARLHARAIARLAAPDVRVVVDQFARVEVMRRALEDEGQAGLELVQAPRAERNPAVAAASVLARSEFLVRLKELGEELGVELPKGAGEPVDAAGRRILDELGLEVPST